MSDIRMMVGSTKFSLRAVILCVRDGHLLVNRTAGDNFWFLPGGAAGSDEDTAAAAAREWTEETGMSAGPLRLVGVVENFFGPDEAREHEVGFYYRMDAPPQLPEASFALTDNPRVHAEWLPLDTIHIRPVYPRAACDLLAVPPGEVRHLVHRE